MRNVIRQRHADLVAHRLRDPSLRFHLFPRHVVFLRADEGEDVVFLAVLAHERRGEPQPPPGLQRAVAWNTGAGSRWTSS